MQEEAVGGGGYYRCMDITNLNVPSPDCEQTCVCVCTFDRPSIVNCSGRFIVWEKL